MTSSQSSRISSLLVPTLQQVRAEQARRAAERERERVARDADAIRERCRTLAGFVREAWHVLEPHAVYVHGWHIDAICEHLEAVSRGLIQRLLVNVPPGSMKSLLISVLFQAWEWGPGGKPGMQYLTTSYTETYARRDARKTRDLILSEWYRALWPHIALTRDGEMSFENADRGYRSAMPFGSLTGGRGNRVILDDPHSVKNIESETERTEAARLFVESVTSRLNNQVQDAIIVVMHRLHPNDICGVIEQRRIDYTKLILPMEFEVKHRCVTPIFSDPRTYEGELLVPDRFPRDKLDAMKASGEISSHAYAGQYQQRPSAREGGMFKKHWFKIVDAIPADVRMVRVRRWDLAASLDTGDWTAGVRMGALDGKFYIDDVNRFRDTGAKVRQAIKNTAAADTRRCVIVIPQDPGQAGKDQAQSIIAENAGYRIYAERETGDKATRAEPLAAQVEAGNVHVLRAPWTDAFIEELCAFPQGNDDQFDAAAGAFNKLASMPKTMSITDDILKRAAGRR